MLIGQRKKSQKYFDLSTFNYNLYDSNPCSSLGVMNFQKWELFSGSPGILAGYVYILKTQIQASRSTKRSLKKYLQVLANFWLFYRESKGPRHFTGMAQPKANATRKFTKAHKNVTSN